MINPEHCPRECEYSKLKAKIELLKTALGPFAEMADRSEYTLDDIDHGWFISAKIALRGGLRVVNDDQQSKTEG